MTFSRSRLRDELDVLIADTYDDDLTDHEIAEGLMLLAERVEDEGTDRENGSRDDG